MKNPQLKALHTESDALIAEIHEAFRRVSRDKGVSWSESVEIDRYEGIERRIAARQSDVDTDWSQLVNDPNWRTDPGIGGFSFLDPIGMRYYLPAAMVRTLQTGDDQRIIFHLGYAGQSETFDWSRSQFSQLDERQRRCVAKFIWLMARLLKTERLSSEACEWLAALEAGWNQYLDTGPRRRAMTDKSRRGS